MLGGYGKVPSVRNWQELVADVAFVFGWSLSELLELELDELLEWHAQAIRLGGK